MLLLLLAHAPPVPSFDPYEIFARARAYWATQHYPHYVNYDTVVDVQEGRRERIERYASAYDASTGEIWVEPVSDYERAHPASGRGLRYCGGPCSNAPGPAPDQDFIGVPVLAPNYAFRIGAANAWSPASSNLSAMMPSALPEIASVVAYKRAYAISLVGTERVGGEDTYHLHLVPFRTDGRYRLRDLWVDDQSFATVRARTSLNFTDGPGTHVPWTIDFCDVAGARYIASETAEGTYVYAKRRYDKVTIRFENVAIREGSLPFTPVQFSAYLILTEPQP